MNEYIKYLPILIVLIVYSARMMEIAKKRDLIKGEIKEGATLRLFKLVGLFVVVAGIVEYLQTARPLLWWTLITGIFVSLFSFYLRGQAIKALGKFWSLHVEIRSNHQFVKSGPFQFVRHPAYTSMVLEILSVGLLLQAPVSTILALLFFVPILYKRITIEEAELISKFGEDYSQYKKTTPALLPIKF